SARGHDHARPRENGADVRGHGALRVVDPERLRVWEPAGSGGRRGAAATLPAPSTSVERAARRPARRTAFRVTPSPFRGWRLGERPGRASTNAQDRPVARSRPVLYV